LVWLKFIACLLIILFAGTKVARYGDAIAEKTGLGRVWIGLILIAVVTTMPEMVTGISSATLVKLPDMAVGTLLGSCIFNISILAVLDVLHRRVPVLSKVSKIHIISAAMGIILIAFTGGSILVGEMFTGLSLGWFGISSIISIILYFAGASQIFRIEQKKKSVSPQDTSLQYEDLAAKDVYLRFALASLAIVGAGIWLSYIGDEIAETTGWGTSFIGSMFLAITTSMPELVVAVTAIRLGAVEMAVADILGANMIDIMAVAIIDLFYVPGPILTDISQSHLITSGILVIMNLIVIAGIVFRVRRKTFVVVGWYAPLLAALYIFGAYILFVNVMD